MPRILKAITATDKSVVRPVVFEIARKLMDITGISKDTQIFYPGEMEKVLQQGSEMNPSGEGNILPFNERISIEVDELFEEDRMGTTAVHREENIPIFLDDDLEILIKPVYASSDMTINFRYRAEDKTAAERWRNEMRARISDAREVRNYSVSYSYLIPPAFLVILEELHRMREAVDGYGETYEEYFNKYCVKKITTLTTQSGSVSSLAVAETQGRIQGWFDFAGVPEQGSSEDESVTWTIGFAFKFKFDKPIDCAMHYPIMIHNQVVDQKYRPSEKVELTEKKVRGFSLSAGYLNHFEAGNETRMLGKRTGYGLPDFDEFICSDVPKSTLRIFTMLMQIDPADKTVLCNLANDLDTIEFTPEIKRFLVDEAPYMTKPYKSVFQITLYRQHDIVSGVPMRVTPELDVFTLEPMDLRSYYHLRVSVVTNFRLLDRYALERAANHGTALIEIIKAIDPTLRNLPQILDDDFIPRSEIDEAIDNMTYWDSLNHDRTRQMNTVETFFIKTR